MALKGAIRDFFYSLLTAPRTVSNTYAQVTRTQSCANHVQHIEHSSRATCRGPLDTKGQLSCWVSQSLNGIHFSFILLAETINPMKEWRKPEYPEKTPDDELQKAAIRGRERSVLNQISTGWCCCVRPSDSNLIVTSGGRSVPVGLKVTGEASPGWKGLPSCGPHLAGCCSWSGSGSGLAGSMFLLCFYRLQYRYYFDGNNVQLPWRRARMGLSKLRDAQDLTEIDCLASSKTRLPSFSLLAKQI